MTKKQIDLGKLDKCQFSALNEEQLNSTGGAIPLLVGGLLVYLAKSAFDHSDQIIKGIRNGYK